MGGHYCGDLDDSGSKSDGEHYIHVKELRTKRKGDKIETQKLRDVYFDEERRDIANIEAGAEAFKIKYETAERDGE